MEIEGLAYKDSPNIDRLSIEFNPHKILKHYRNGSKKRNNGNLRKESCEACGSAEALTVHHPFKRTVFGENDCVITLCINCHRNIERQIYRMERKILKSIQELYYFIQNLLYYNKINFKDNKTFVISITNLNERKYSFILENKKME